MVKFFNGNRGNEQKIQHLGFTISANIFVGLFSIFVAAIGKELLAHDHLHRIE